MTEQVINEQSLSIYSLLKSKRLKEAFVQLEVFLSQVPDWGLQNRLDELKMSYSYMLQYMEQGVADPSRGALYQKLLRNTWELADQVKLHLLDSASSKHYHIIRRQWLSDDVRLLKLQQQITLLESFDDDFALSDLWSKEKKRDVLNRHEVALKEAFFLIWSNSAWTVEDSEAADKMLQSDLLRVSDLALLVSAVTLSVVSCFDIRKVLWLLEAYSHVEVQVSQRALVGFVWVSMLHADRITFYPEIGYKLEALNEMVAVSDDLMRVYGQLLLSQETEKIDRKMREEIIPELIKNVSADMEVDESDEEDEKLDWQRKLESSGVSDKMMEMNELQEEGADVYMSSFSFLKSDPFFNEIHHWFYTFDKLHLGVADLLQGRSDNQASLMDLILDSVILCNSDKYSMYFTLLQVPESQRKLLFDQFAKEDINKESLDTVRLTLEREAEKKGVFSNQYIRDLYRFLKLNRYRSEFKDVFKERINLHRLPHLKPYLENEKTFKSVANFCFRKERWEEAAELFKEQIEWSERRQALSSESYQKLGYALQKLKNYAGAVDFYQKADLMAPDHLWTNRHLATCYRLLADYESALTYYKKVEAVHPAHKQVLSHIGHCLIKLARYDEALNYFFKLHFMDDASVKALRGIGWSSFMLSKNEQALKFYERLLAIQPSMTDYLSAGHVAWSMNQLEKALLYYRKALELVADRTEFLKLFYQDEALLIQRGVSKDDIPLVLELL